MRREYGDAEAGVAGAVVATVAAFEGDVMRAWLALATSCPEAFAAAIVFCA
eukprot:m.361759 g.361759  ORF g.361759 m.361759 type:complete len:51 (+) comp19959_c0_seq7:4163-4315(+)